MAIVFSIFSFSFMEDAIVGNGLSLLFFFCASIHYANTGASPGYSLPMQLLANALGSKGLWRQVLVASTPTGDLAGVLDS